MPIVNKLVVVEPAELVTMMLGVPNGAFALIVNVAVIDRPFAGELKLEKLSSPNHCEFVATLSVAPVRLVPFKVTVPVQPGGSMFGLMPVIVGAAPLVML